MAVGHMALELNREVRADDRGLGIVHKRNVAEELEED